MEPVERTPSTEPERRASQPLRRGGMAVGALVLAVALFVGGVATDRAGLVPFWPAAPVASTDTNRALVDQAWDLLKQHYVDSSSLDWTKIAYGAIDGMTQAVGDVGHTTFLTPQQLAAEHDALSGSYVGIGAVIDTSETRPVIVSVFAGSPAAGAGLGHGDLIISINGTDTSAMSLPTVSARIRGPAGSTVTLVIQSAGSSARRTVRVQRAQVDIPAVAWTMVPGTHVADIHLVEFSTGAADALGKAIDAAQKAGATGILLDLRNNPGGYVQEAIGVASRFISSGVVYVSEDASGTRTSVDVAAGEHATSLPLVVLVNHATASAAEIVAGALQDHQRARIVGETTFGTGTVLMQYDLADGSALQIGTQKWLTPSGHQIWHHGITPDRTVALASGVEPLMPDGLKSMSAAQVAASKDAQLETGLNLLGATP